MPELAAAPLPLAVPVQLDVGTVRHEVVHPLVQARAGPVGVSRRAAATSVPELEEQLTALGRGYGRNTAPQTR